MDKAVTKTNIEILTSFFIKKRCKKKKKKRKELKVYTTNL